MFIVLSINSLLKDLSFFGRSFCFGFFFRQFDLKKTLTASSIAKLKHKVIAFI